MKSTTELAQFPAVSTSRRNWNCGNPNERCQASDDAMTAIVNVLRITASDLGVGLPGKLVKPSSSK